MNIIEVSSLVKIYAPQSRSPVYALNGVDLTVSKGEMIAVQGPSGCGKSTLLHILGYLDDATEGSYRLNGKEIAFSDNGDVARLRGETIGFVLQNYGLIGERTVYENVIIPLIFTGKSVKKADNRISELLEQFGILSLKNKHCSSLSGGERQRVAITRALVNSPELILADEPTGALDSKNGALCIEMLRSINMKGTTVVIVTHDPTIAAACDRIIHMKDGRIVG